MITFFNQFRNEQGLTMAGKFIVSFFIIVATVIVAKIISWGIERLFNRKIGERSPKAKTLMSVLNNIIRVVVFFIGLTLVLDTFGVNTNSLIATAGIGGIALGFGAQSIVKDVISGAFLLVEDQFSIGDYIIVDSLEGYVVQTGLRLTKLRAFNGEIHYIPNGNITAVTNISRGPMRALVKIKIPDQLPIETALDALSQAMEKYSETVDFFETEPEVLGITDTMEFNQIVSIVGHTKPMRQWEAERGMRYYAYQALQALKEEGHARTTAL